MIVVVAGALAGCAGHSVSSSDGPLSFDLNCTDWTVRWTKDTAPHIGLVMRKPPAPPASAHDLDDYLGCAQLGPKRALERDAVTRGWGSASFFTPDRRNPTAPVADHLEIRLGTPAQAQAAHIDFGAADPAGRLVVTVVERCCHPLPSDKRPADRYG